MSTGADWERLKEQLELTIRYLPVDASLMLKVKSSEG
jgi:hypothetical protein